MRLTLRTLLAYLDDVLEPADAREIGSKISESATAAAMVERIREVMRRRRITAPELTGPGSGPDPNLVAEYLDNTLSPEAVAEIERICLESDVHLAETAGCHQILTIVLGEPVDLTASTRQRMYALGAIAPPQGQSSEMETREPIPPATADTRRTAAEAAAAVQTGDETFAQGLPDYLRRRPLWRRLTPVAVAAVLLAWLAFVLYDLKDSFLPTTPTVATNSRAPAADANEPPAAEPAAEEPAREEPVATSTEPPPADAEATIAALADSINPEPPPDLVEPVAEPPVEPSAEPAAEPTADVEATPTTDSTAPGVEPPPPAVIENAPTITYTNLDGVVLRYDQEANDWYVLERHTSVSPADWIAAPLPFTARLDVAGGQLVIGVVAGAAMQSIAPPEDCLTSLYVDRGRIVLSRPAGEEASPDPVNVAVQVGQQQFDVELLEPGTLVGIEVLLRQPEGYSEEPQDLGFGGGMFLVAGSATVQPEGGEPLVLSADNGWLAWPDPDGVWQPGPLLSNPLWIDAGGPVLPQVTAAYAKQYERLFPLDQSVAAGVPAIVRDRRAQISRFAVETLGLTQNIPQLLRALQAEHDEARQTAIVEIRKWLPRSPDNAGVLRDELGRYFRDDEVDALNELLWGYSADDLRDAEVSTRIVDWLADDNVAIRELALYHIKTGTNRPTDYHPLAPIVQRQAAIARLHEVVRRQGGLLPQAE